MEGPVGFVGLGRLGVPIASLLLEAGNDVVCCARGRSAELVARGAKIAGDGSPRAVGEAAAVVFTCLPAEGLEPAFAGEDGLLSADRPAPVCVELSTAPIAEKLRLRAAAVARGVDLLDCPMSGTPAMVAARKGVVYASGDREAYERVAPLLHTISPDAAYVGELGAGTRMKFVANLLVLVHVAAAAEAMALATSLGLDLDMVAELVARSPAASSGQFSFRAPMIAAGQFDGKLVTVKDAREVLAHITTAAVDAGAVVPLATTAKRLFDELGDGGDDDSDPGKLAVLLAGGTGEPSGAARDGSLFVAVSTAQRSGSPLPADVIDRHLKWAAELERQGAIVAAGPFVDDDGAIAADGLYIVRAQSRAEAAELLAGDPFHAEGLRRCTIRGWSLHQGAVGVASELGDRSAKPA